MIDTKKKKYWRIIDRCAAIERYMLDISNEISEDKIALLPLNAAYKYMIEFVNKIKDVE